MGWRGRSAGIKLPCMEPCIFCGSKDDPADVEDVIPKWARRAFDIQGPVTVTAVELSGSLKRPVGRMDVLKVVLNDALCRPCNNKWLGGSIEKSAARLFRPMAVGRQPALLDAAAQRLAAFWGVKTALLLELAIRQMHPGQRPVEGYAASSVELAYMRTYTKPPPLSMVWLGCYDCEQTKPVCYEPSSAVLPTADGSPVVGHFATFTLGYVVFQVFTVDFLAAELHGAKVWNTHVPKSLAQHLVRIWPEQLVRPDVSWPLEQFASDEWCRLVTWDGVLRPGGLMSG